MYIFTIILIFCPCLLLSTVHYFGGWCFFPFYESFLLFKSFLPFLSFPSVFLPYLPLCPLQESPGNEGKKLWTQWNMAIRDTSFLILFISVSVISIQGYILCISIIPLPPPSLRRDSFFFTRQIKLRLAERRSFLFLFPFPFFIHFP